MNVILGWLVEYEYAAMFGILTLCGVGLPLPEEVTLLGSGLLVGWGDANFWLATLACSAGILVGDSLVFGLGRHAGRRFLQSAPMNILLPPARQASVQVFFVEHGTKALFLARFFPGVRIGVYAYAGSQRIAWARFVCVDGLGILISGPTSVWVGRAAARAMGGDRQAAMRLAAERMHGVGAWIALLLVGGVVLIWGAQTLWRRRKPRGARP